VATQKQKAVVEKLSENIGTKGELLLAAGYSKSISESPAIVLESKGIKELIAQGEGLGLTDQKCIQTVIKALDDKNLATALNAVRFWFGMKYPDTKESKNTTIVIPILGGQTNTITQIIDETDKKVSENTALD